MIQGATLASMTRHITGTRIPTVTRQVIDLVRGGDDRPVLITLLGRPGLLHDRPGIVTPHRDAHGELDVADISAQVFAVAFDLPAGDGPYTDGVIVNGDICYFVPGPSGEWGGGGWGGEEWGGEHWGGEEF